MQRFVQSSAVEARAMMLPTRLERGWRAAVLSKRKQAVLRRQALRENTYGSWTPGRGGWLAEWDAMAPQMVMKPPKQHAHHRKLTSRMDRITLGLAKQPQMEAEMKASRVKPLTGLDKWIASKD